MNRKVVVIIRNLNVGKVRFDLIFLRVLLVLLCVGSTTFGWAEGLQPGDTITLIGKNNNESVSHSDVLKLNVKVDAEAELTAWGNGAAIELGAGSTVTMEEGAKVSFGTGGESPQRVQGIKMDGTAQLSDDNRVFMKKESCIYVVGAQKTDVVAVEIANTESAHIDMDGATLKSVSKFGDAIGIHLTGVTNVNTAQVEMKNIATIQVDRNGSERAAQAEDWPVEGYGILVEDSPHGVVSLDGGSVIAVTGLDTEKCTEASSIALAFKGVADTEVTLGGASRLNAIQRVASDGSHASNAKAMGLLSRSNDRVNVVFQESADITSRCFLDGGSGIAESWGINISGSDDAKVQLLSESLVFVDAHATAEGAKAVSVGAFMGDIDEAELVLSDRAVMVSVARAKTTAEAVGVQLGEIHAENTAKLRVEKGSAIRAESYGANALTIGGLILNSPHAVVEEQMGSCISAKAASEEHRADNDEVESNAVASGLSVGFVPDVDILMDGSQVDSIVSVASENTGTGTAKAVIGQGKGGAIPSGIGILGSESATLDLSNARVTLIAEATASADQGESSACIGDRDRHISVSGLMVGENPADPNVNVNLVDVPEPAKESGVAIVLEKNSSISVNAEANAGTQSEVYAAGVQLLNLSGDVNTLSLDDSSVIVDAKATATDDAGDSVVEAMGILVDATRGTNTLSLNNAMVAVKAEASDAMAVGIGVMSKSGGGEYTINLANNSRVSALALTGTEGDPDSSGAIFVTDARGEINIDSTSEVHGVWAVCREKDKESAFAAVNNHGLIHGRLDVDTLHNFASGILQADLGTDEAFTHVAGNEDQAFYFKIKTATLDAGTTFQIIPEGINLTPECTEKEYLLLKSENTDGWDLDTLNLVVKSPLLGLSWSEKSSDTELIAKAQFLMPSEAGLSSNAIGAVKAAMADMPSDFVFGTDPESWSPNVNGAFLSGMTQTVGASHSNIGNRLGGLMGLNSGDEVVASGGLWYNASFTDADQDERGGVVGFDADTTGLSLGLDRQVGPLTVGAAFTQGKSEAKADDKSSEMDMNDSLFSLYGSYDGGAWFGEAVLSAGMGDVDSVRRVGDQAFAADYDSTSYNAIAKAGVRLRAAGWEVNPLLTVEYSFKDYDSYTESGGKDSGALEVDSQDYTVINVGGGTTLQRSWLKGWGVITPEMTAMVRYDLKGDGILTTAKFVGGSTAFVARGADPAETSWELSTALTIASLEESAVSVRLGYDYAGREDFAAHSVSGKVRFEF